MDILMQVGRWVVLNVWFTKSVIQKKVSRNYFMNYYGSQNNLDSCDSLWGSFLVKESVLGSEKCFK